MASWKRLNTGGPVPRGRCGQSWTAWGECVYLFGGGDDDNTFDDFYCFDTGTLQWSEVVAAGTGPSARQGHSCVLHQKWLVLFGGGDLLTYQNDVHLFDLEASEWTTLKTSGFPPSARAHHSATMVDNKMYVLGGFDGTQHLNDLWTLDLASDRPSWSRVDPKDVAGPWPEAVSQHSCSLVGSRLVVLGGESYAYNGADYSQISVFDTVALVWEQNVPPLGFKRSGHSTAHLGDRLVISFGWENKEVVDGTLLVETGSLAVSPLATVWDLPEARAQHSSVAVNGCVYVFGGWDNRFNYFNSVHVLTL